MWDLDSGLATPEMATGDPITKQEDDHAQTHQGQLIAYARMNDVPPPWSRPQ